MTTPHRKSVLKAISIFALLLIYGCSEPKIEWTAVQVSGSKQSGDAHLLKFPSGTVILLDTGFRHYASRDLIPALKERDIGTIDKVLISHAHRNHYGAIPKLFEHFKVKEVFFNLPPLNSCKKELWNSGCRIEHIMQMFSLIKEQSNLKHVSEGDLIHQEKDISLRAIYYLDNSPSLIPGIGVNDASIVFKLEYGNSSVLFTGDLGPSASNYILNKTKDSKTKLKSTAMTAPHHGVSATVTNEFYDQVQPKLVVASISKSIWQSERGQQTREYFNNKNIPIYVTGEMGNIDISISKKNIELKK